MFKFIGNIITYICRKSVSHPWLWLAASFLVTLPFVFQFSRIGLDTDLIRLLPEDSRAVVMKKQVDEIATDSGGFFALLIESKNSAALYAALAEAVAVIEKMEGVGGLEYRNHTQFFKKFRYALAPEEFLNQILDFFIRLESRVNPMGEDLLGEEPDSSQNAGSSPEEKEKKDKEEIRKWMRFLNLSEYHLSEDGAVAGIRVFPFKGLTNLGRTKKLYSRLDALSSELRLKHGVWTGVGGSLRNSIDQYDFIIVDLSRSSTITFVTVLLALIVGFLGIRILPVVLLPLFLGLAWTMGSVPLLVGDLNTITSFLLLVSFGLGIDFSIHLVKRLQHEMNLKTFPEAMEVTFKSTGASVIVSALTTALVLFVLAFSNFRGFSEFGVVGGCSLMMILAAMILFLPAYCVLGFRWGLIKPSVKRKRAWIRVPGLFSTICMLVLLVVSLLYGWKGLDFNFDFGKMDVDLPQHKEIRDRFYKVYESGRSPGAVFIANGLENLDQVILKLEEAKKRENSRIERYHHIRELSPDLSGFQRRLGLIGEIKDAVSGRWIDRVEDADYKRWIKDLREWTAPDGPPELEDLPDEIRDRFASRTKPGHYIVPVYIKGEKQKGKNAMAFTDELNSLSLPSGVIGPFGETTVLADVLNIVTAEGPWMMAITFVGVFILVLLGQRSFTETLWIMAPLVAAFVLTMGVMALFGLTLNFFNIVVFPTLLGMGVDYGVHYYRRWREAGMATELVQYELFGPLTLTAVTTIFGYIGIVFSRHPGLKSIGVLACIGLSSVLFTSLALLPGVLKIIARKKQKTDGW